MAAATDNRTVCDREKGPRNPAIAGKEGDMGVAVEVNNDIALLQQAKATLNAVTRLRISNISATTEREVKVLLSAYDLEEVKLDVANKIACVRTKDPFDAKDILEKFDGKKMLDNVLNIEFLSSENLLCIAHLPNNFKPSRFEELVNKQGEVNFQFLFRSEIHNGASKDYGFVDYKPTENLPKIINDLDWLEINGVKIHCDVVKPELAIAYEYLHSKCLLVDNLPKNFSDHSYFREVFSKIKSPIYCQIVMKNGDPIGYGIIEYKSLIDAENTQRKLNGHPINNKPMRVTYCIPGKSAFEICSKLLKKYEEEQLKTLKESVTADSIYPNPTVINNTLVSDMCKQHPKLLQNFKEALQQLQVAQMSTKNTKPGILGAAPSVGMNPLMDANLQLGLFILLGIQCQQESNNLIGGPLGLLTKLSEQMYKPQSILGDPGTAQATIILQNLVTHILPSGKSGDGSVNAALQSLSANLQNVDLNWLINLGQMTMSMRPQELTAITKVTQSQEHHGLGITNHPPAFYNGPMEGDEPSSGGQSILGEPPQNLVNAITNPHSFIRSLKDSFLGKGVQSELTNLVKNISENQVGKSGFSILGEPPKPSSSFSRTSNMDADKTARYGGPNSRQYSDSGAYGYDQYGPVSLSKDDSGYGGSFSRGHGSTSSYSFDERDYHHGSNTNYNAMGSSDGQNGNGQSSGYEPYSSNSQSSSENQCNNYEAMSEKARAYAASSAAAHYNNGQMSASYKRGYGQYDDPSMYNYNYDYSQTMDNYQWNYGNSSQNAPKSKTPPTSYQGSAVSYQNYSSDQYSGQYPHDSGSYGQQSDVSQYYTSQKSGNPSSYNYPNPPGGYSSSFSSEGVKRSRLESDLPLVPPGMASTPLSKKPPAPPGEEGILGAYGENSDSSYRTPTGQKRSYSQLLPPPEPSPESGYIGQHSQGIGGHYADSYKAASAKRQRLESGYLNTGTHYT